MPDRPVANPALRLPAHRDLCIGGAWRAPLSGRRVELTSPGDGRSPGPVAEAGPADAKAAIAAAKAAFPAWRATPPLERVQARCGALKPGLPTEMATDVGAIVSKARHDRIMGYIGGAKAEGARLACGGTS